MWSLGSELVQRYPLGVGPDNSKYMQVIDPTLPHPHQHMHNNFLNVLVESGWLGLAAYLWWIYEAIKLGLIMFLHRFNTKGQTNRLSGLLALALSVSILGWQTAGLVEYNFGDGEIRLIGLFIMGLLLALHSVEEKEENS
jgi:O-antigen ligase